MDLKLFLYDWMFIFLHLRLFSFSTCWSSIRIFSRCVLLSKTNCSHAHNASVLKSFFTLTVINKSDWNCCHSSAQPIWDCKKNTLTFVTTWFIHYLLFPQFRHFLQLILFISIYRYIYIYYSFLSASSECFCVSPNKFCNCALSSRSYLHCTWGSAV